MIPADRSYIAHFEGPGSVTRHIIAWADDGHPMVVGDRGLVRAEVYDNYAGVMEDTPPVVNAIPGGGWVIHRTDDDGVSWIVPILAWAIHADGSVWALGTDDDGRVQDVTIGYEDYRIYHPGTEQTAELPKPFRWDPNCMQCCGTSWVPADVSDESEAVKRCSCYNASPGAVAPPRQHGLPAWYKTGEPLTKQDLVALIDVARQQPDPTAPES